MRVCRRFTFAMAHLLREHPGACRRLHGHNYVLEVEVTGCVDVTGMVIDFGTMKSIVNKVLENYDHRTLLQYSADAARIAGVQSPESIRTVAYTPTAENMLRHGLVPELCAALPVPVSRVRLYETENCWAEEVLS